MTHRTSLQSTAERLRRELFAGLDLTDAGQLEQVDAVTTSLLEAASRDSLGVDALRKLEHEFSRRDDVPLMLHLAIKLARSRLVCAEITGPLRVSVVFAMYKEHNRILSAERHPHGEDFLVRKVAQMDRLLSDLPQIEWQLIAVDDGCPEGSGRLAEEIIEREGLSQRARVLFLEEAIRDRLPVASPMTSTAESQKGGAIAYGMWDATRSPHPSHVVVFTDADLSTHLGQVGLLLEAIESGFDVAIGSRREPESVVVKAGGRKQPRQALHLPVEAFARASGLHRGYPVRFQGLYRRYRTLADRRSLRKMFRHRSRVAVARRAAPSRLHREGTDRLESTVRLPVPRPTSSPTCRCCKPSSLSIGDIFCPTPRRMPLLNSSSNWMMLPGRACSRTYLRRSPTVTRLTSTVVGWSAWTSFELRLGDRCGEAVSALRAP